MAWDEKHSSQALERTKDIVSVEINLSRFKWTFPNPIEKLRNKNLRRYSFIATQGAEKKCLFYYGIVSNSRKFNGLPDRAENMNCNQRPTNCRLCYDTYKTVANHRNVKSTQSQIKAMWNQRNVKSTQCEINTMANQRNVKSTQSQIHAMTNQNNINSAQC
jgi:hypothetical protein